MVGETGVFRRMPIAKEVYGPEAGFDFRLQSLAMQQGIREHMSRQSIPVQGNKSHSWKPAIFAGSYHRPVFDACVASCGTGSSRHHLSDSAEWFKSGS
jgi:hypothetical protein